MRLVYLTSVELAMTPTLVRDAAERDGHTVINVEAAAPESFFIRGDTRFWNHDALDFWLVDVERL